jgi:hypothetical protein
MLSIFSCNFFTLAMFLSLKRHLVPARSARKLSIVLSGSISSPHVRSCILYVMMPSGKRFVKCAKGVIVG